MRTLAVLNVKGGVGKTVSAVNIAVCLAQRGSKVLLIDVDAQANATRNLGCYEKQEGFVGNIFDDAKIGVDSIMMQTEIENLYVLPSHIEFAKAESKILLDTTRQQQTRLKKALRQIQDAFDYCVIDCPPALGLVTINALVAADAVTVPIKIDQFALDGLNYLMETVSDIRDEFNEALQFLGCFITMDNRTSVYTKLKAQLQEISSLKLLSTTIPKTCKVDESTFVAPVVVYDPKCTASKGYEALTLELMQRWG